MVPSGCRVMAIMARLEAPAGTMVTLCIGAANRDPERFEDPERFDIARQPNPHLAFATGIHTCLGMTLARLEGRIAIAGLFRRFPDVELAGPATHQRRSRFRGYVSLPARLNRRRRFGEAAARSFAIC